MAHAWQHPAISAVPKPSAERGQASLGQGRGRHNGRLLYEVDFPVLYPLTVVLIAGATESAPGLADDRAALLMMHPTLAR